MQVQFPVNIHPKALCLLSPNIRTFLAFELAVDLAVTNRRVTRIFLGRGVFLELGHFDKHSPWQEKEKPRRLKISGSFAWKLKNFILNDKFYLKTTTIRAFFLQIRALFSNFQKRAGETSPLSPLVTRLPKKNNFD